MFGGLAGSWVCLERRELVYHWRRTGRWQPHSSRALQVPLCVCHSSHLTGFPALGGGTFFLHHFPMKTHQGQLAGETPVILESKPRVVLAHVLLSTHLGPPQVAALSIGLSAPSLMTSIERIIVFSQEKNLALGSFLDHSQIQLHISSHGARRLTPGCRAQRTPHSSERVLSPCCLHTKVIYSSMYRANEVVWLMDTNRYCFF